MLVQNSVLGQVEVDSADILHLPDGLYGFESKGDFAIIKALEEDVTLTWLQPIDSKSPCFVVFDPFEIISNYAPALEQSDMKYLGASSVSDLNFWVIAVVPEDMAETTVNLKSPIIVNKKTRRARQVILQNQDYPIKFPLFPSEQPTGEAQP